MQLSLPAVPFPTPAAAPACGVKTPASQTDSPDTPADSFDSLLSKDQPKDEKSDDDAANPGAEQAAGILAAMLWMPVPAVTNPPPVLPAAGLDSSAVSATSDGAESAGSDGMAENAVVTPFSSPTSSRVFASLIAPTQIGVSTLPADPVGTNSSNAVLTATVAPSENPAIAPASACTPDLVAPATTVSSNVAPAVVTATAVPVMATATNVITKPVVAPVGKAPAKISNEAKSLPLTTDDSSDLSTSDATDVISATVDSLSNTVTPLSAAKAVTPGSANSAALSPQEKIAPQPVVAVDDSKSAADLAEKYFLKPVQKAVTAVGTSVGIAVARLNAAMSAATSARSKSTSLNEPVTSFVFSTEAAPTATLTVDAPAPVATVRETLAAVISAVDALERRADVQQKSVDLQFHVGNEKLGLRVELKDGAVHTTFRTESPEMNSALAREWHSVVPTGLAREIRLAEPVFNTVATSGSDSAFTSLGQNAQQQREQQKAPPTFSSALKREFYDSSVQETAAPAAATTSNSSQLLNVLA